MRFAWYAIPMKYMGIDYGTKRIGVALTDDKCMMAFPYAVYANDASILKTIEALAQKEHVEKIVLGHSLRARRRTK
jgi:putative Holliday junction resolvase